MGNRSLSCADDLVALFSTSYLLVPPFVNVLAHSLFKEVDISNGGYIFIISML